jgi:hypothetical protein
MLDQRPHERFDALVRHQRHLDPPRVLQPRGEDVHLRFRAVLGGDPHLTEIVL